MPPASYVSFAQHVEPALFQHATNLTAAQLPAVTQGMACSVTSSHPPPPAELRPSTSTLFAPCQASIQGTAGGSISPAAPQEGQRGPTAASPASVRWPALHLSAANPIASPSVPTAGPATAAELLRSLATAAGQPMDAGAPAAPAAPAALPSDRTVALRPLLATGVQAYDDRLRMRMPAGWLPHGLPPNSAEPLAHLQARS